MSDSFVFGAHVRFQPNGGATGTDGIVLGPSAMGDGWVEVRHLPAVYRHADGSVTLSPDVCSMAKEHLQLVRV